MMEMLGDFFRKMGAALRGWVKGFLTEGAAAAFIKLCRAGTPEAVAPVRGGRQCKGQTRHNGADVGGLQLEPGGRGSVARGRGKRRCEV